MNRQPLGSPVNPDMQRNCVLCNRWRVCRDPEKAYHYACTKFTPNEAVDLGALMDTAETATESIETEIANARDEDSIEAVIEKVLNSGIPVPPDIKIDDRHIPRPPNVVDWMCKPEFAGSALPPFGKQIQVGAHFMAEWCPRCSDEDYFENVPVADRHDDIYQYVEFLKFGKCPRCHATKNEMVASGELDDPEELIGIAGQRSSKTITMTLIDSYGISRWLTTPNLPQTFGILPNTVLTATYTALTFGQARENYWEPLNSLIRDDSAWFKQYHSFLQQLGDQLGEDLITHTDTLLRYRHKNILCAPASPSKRVMRGRTRITGLIDELGIFPVGQKQAGGDYERLDAKELHKSLRNSLKTMSQAYRLRFSEGYSNLPKPIMGSISSPLAINDMIMTLHRLYANSPKAYCFKYPTWEFNPTLTRASFEEEFRLTPVEAARDYGCEPPLATNPWLRDHAAAASVFSGPRNGVKTTRIRTRSASQKILTSANWKAARQPTSEYGGLLSIDAGWNNNSYAMSIAYPTTVPDMDDPDNEDLHVGVEFFAFIEVIPKLDAPMSYTHFFNNVIGPICDRFNIAALVSDRWQNKKTAQDLEELVGVEPFEYQCKMADFDEFREGLFNGSMVFPQLERPVEEILGITLEEYPSCFETTPMSHLLYQMLTVVSTGRTVIKGDATDDLFRTAVLGYTQLQDPEILDVCLNYSTSDVRPRMVIGANSTGPGSTAGRVGIQASLSDGGAASLGALGGRGGGGAVARGGRTIGINGLRMG